MRGSLTTSENRWNRVTCPQCLTSGADEAETLKTTGDTLEETEEGRPSIPQVLRPTGNESSRHNPDYTQAHKFQDLSSPFYS